MTEGIGTARDKVRTGPAGIGGWLILPLLGLFITTAWTGFNIVTGVAGGALQFPFMALRGEILPEYFHLSWIFPLSLLIALGTVVLGILCLVRFFQKRHALPKLMIAFYAILGIGSIFDAATFYAYPILLDDPADLGGTYGETARTVIACVIWSAYFSVSKRVEATFVN